MNCCGVEISDRLFDVAQNEIRLKKLERCKIYRQSVTALDLPSDSFDFVIVRLVLEHLPDPLVAMREVFRVLKDGGRAVFIDNDFDFHVRTFPDVPELADLYKGYCDARIQEGGNPRIGRELTRFLEQSGYADISVNTITAHNAITGDEAFHNSEGSGIALQLVRKGFLSNVIYDRLAVNWSTMLKTPGHSIIRLLFVGSGIKNIKVIGNTEGASIPVQLKDSGVTIAAGKHTLVDHVSKGTIVNGLIQAFAEVMEISPDIVSPDIALGDIGMDSVASVMLRNQIENEIQINLPSLDFLNDHSIYDIADFIKERINSNNPQKNRKDSINTEFEEGVI